MNFLSSAISSLTGTSIPYTFKEKVIDPASADYPDSYSIWTVYNGVNPKNDTPVSIFEFSTKDPVAVQRNYEPLARNASRKLKLIKFPGVISVIDYIENDSNVYIVTERVKPLARYLTEYSGKVSTDAKLYGIYGVAHALLFINMKAQCLHGHLDIALSVFVNSQGEWKLFGFELLTNLTSDPDQPFYRLSQFLPKFHENLPNEVSNGGVDAIRSFAIKYDSYRLGVFIFSVLTNTDFSQPIIVDHGDLVKGSLRLPKELVLSFKKLVNVKPNLRITVDKFTQETEEYFSASPLVSFSKILEEIKFQNDADKLAFFKNDLAHYVDGEFPPGYLENKLLPEIITQFNNLAKTKPTVNTTPEQHQQRQETMSVLLNYILKLSGSLSEEMFAKYTKPVIFHSFTLLDRSIRLILLKYLPSYSLHLTDSEVQSKIFYNLITGFQDTNFMIRETTLTSITTIIDKVSVKQVNQDLLKVLAKLQMDPKPSIRTNTLILIIKISDKIYLTSRNSVIITALSKSLRDSFTPCKVTALLGFEKLIDQFSLDEICGKILGNLAVALMDPKSAKIRTEAKRIFELYLGSVERHAASLPTVEEDEDAEEKEFFAKNAPEVRSETPKSDVALAKTPAATSTTTTSGGFGLGWGMVNKLVSSDVGGTLDNSFNRSTPDLTRVPTPTTDTTTWNDVLSDSGWSDKEEEEVEPVATVPSSRTVQRQNAGNSARIGARPTPTSRTNTVNKVAASSTTKPGKLKLGAQQKKPATTLKLDVPIDDDDSWGSAW